MSLIYNKRSLKNKLTSLEFLKSLWNNKRAGTLTTSLLSVNHYEQMLIMIRFIKAIVKYKISTKSFIVISSF